MRYRDRVHAGRELACELAGRFTGDALVLALSGGGVVVGAAVAGSAGASLCRFPAAAGEFRHGREPAGRNVLLVDEMMSNADDVVEACEVVRAAGARRIMVATPVASIDAVGRIRAVAHDVSVLQLVSEPGDAADWYDDPTPVAPEVVARALSRHVGPTLVPDGQPGVGVAGPLNPGGGDPGPPGQRPPVLLQAG